MASSDRRRLPVANTVTEHYPRYMLPRASGMSTMGEIHALGPSPPTRSPADSTVNLVGYDQASAYPATWHEYEDQFNYFYNCHFIEQDYYDYLAGSLHRPNSNGEEDINDDYMESYSDENVDVDVDVADIDVHMGEVIVDQSALEIHSNTSATSTEAELSDEADPAYI